eukprot:810237-Prymnesium_polylepis.1
MKGVARLPGRGGSIVGERALVTDAALRAVCGFAPLRSAKINRLGLKRDRSCRRSAWLGCRRR